MQVLQSDLAGFLVLAKCSFHRLSWSSVLVRITLFFSLTGVLWTVPFPLSSLVVSYTFLMSRFSAASFASRAMSSILFLLSPCNVFSPLCSSCCKHVLRSTSHFLSLRPPPWLSPCVSPPQVSRCLRSSTPFFLF